MWFGKGARCDISGELVVQPNVDLRGNQLRLLEVQEVSDAVDDLESRSVSRKVRAEVAEQVTGTMKGLAAAAIEESQLLQTRGW